MHKYFPKSFAIIDGYDKSLFKYNTSDFGIIYRNYKSISACSELNKIALNCRKKRIPFFISNNIRQVIKYKATGIYLPAFNKSGIRNLLFAKKNILVLGSAHNAREIKEKINQGCDAIFVSPVFKTKNYKKTLGIYKFNLLTRNSKIKFYQASTSEMYGNNKFKTQNEETPFSPASPYAISKLYAHWITNVYRKSYDMFASCGILFNHESPIRGMEFVSRKITNAAAEISLGLKDKLVLGNLNAKRDWGFAQEYMQAVHSVMQQEKPDNFVICTGESHKVSDFVKEAFDIVGLNWKKYVKTDKKFFRPLELNYLRGDAKKAAKQLKWKPKTTFKKLVKMMVDEDVKRWKNFLDGKAFPWDAPLYPDESKLITRLSSRKN